MAEHPAYEISHLYRQAPCFNPRHPKAKPQMHNSIRTCCKGMGMAKEWEFVAAHIFYCVFSSTFEGVVPIFLFNPFLFSYTHSFISPTLKFDCLVHNMLCKVYAAAYHFTYHFDELLAISFLILRIRKWLDLSLIKYFVKWKFEWFSSAFIQKLQKFAPNPYSIFLSSCIRSHVIIYYF